MSSPPAENGQLLSSGLRIFVSSPFKEFGSTGSLEDWELREHLGTSLREARYSPWLFKDERKKIPTSECTDEQLIERGIEASDFLVAFFKIRAGSLLRPYPLHASIFEIAKAIQFEKPVLLYHIGNAPDRALKNCLALLRSKVFVAKERHFPEQDDELISRTALSDIADLHMLVAEQGTSTTPAGIQAEDYDASFFESMLSQISDLASQGDYFGAMQRVGEIPVSPDVAFGKRETRLYADVMAQCGAIHANMLRFRPAVLAKQISIKLFFRTWDLHDAFGQISALSGILQMFGKSEAVQHNNLALQGAGSHFRDLIPGALDARGSIAIHNGQFADAARLFKRVIELQHTESPYIATKLTFAGGVAAGRAGISRARYFHDDQILPWARETGRDLPFAIKGSARLALWDRDYLAALRLISEAREFCLARGLFHPLAELSEMESKCHSAIEPLQ